MSLVSALLGGVVSWLLALTWMPFSTRPSGYVVPLAVLLVLVAVTGEVLRRLGLRWWWAPPLQLGLAGLGLWWHFRELGPLWRSLVDGAAALNSQQAPVSAADHPTSVVFLAAIGVLLGVGVDLLALGARHVIVTGLPLLLALTVPVSTLTQPVPLRLLVAALVCFGLLLMLEHRRRSGVWGESITPRIRRPILPVVAACLGAGAVVAGGSSV